MRSTYRVLAILIAVVVVLQAASIAFAWFDVLHAVDDGKAFSDIDDRNAGHDMHSLSARCVIAAARAAAADRLVLRQDPRRRASGRLIVFGVMLLQWVLAFIAFGAPAIGFLHGINAFVLAGVAGRASGLAVAGGHPGVSRTPSAA